MFLLVPDQLAEQVARKKGKWGGTSAGRDENGQMDVWHEATRQSSN